MSRDSVIELIDVSKLYEGGVRALSHVHLSISEGELVVVVGNSGSGKTTMLHVMGTLDRPTEGQVLVRGIDVTALDDTELSAVRGRMIGFVFQQFFLLSGASALDNVATGLLYHGVAKAERRERAAFALEQVGMSHRLDHDPARLSGGERQRVAIARALVSDPDVVLADEPTGNLDSARSDEIVELMRDLNRAGRTIVVITHDRQLATRLGRQIELLDGCIVRDSPSSIVTPVTGIAE